jgi:hypothetical protein
MSQAILFELRRRNERIGLLGLFDAAQQACGRLPARVLKRLPALKAGGVLL